MAAFPSILQELYAQQAKSGAFGFIGPAYQGMSSAADGERCVNLFLEYVNRDGGHGKNDAVLYGTPGLEWFCTLPDPQIRNLWFESGRLFAVANGNLYEIQQDKAITLRGPVGDDARPASIASNGKQLCIISAGLGYIFDLLANTLTPIVTDAWARASSVTFIDQYFVVSEAGTRQFFISSQLDGNTWSGLDKAAKEGASDPLVAVFADHEELWLFGSETTEVWYDSGGASFPFQRIQGALVEQGSAAPDSIAKIDNSIFWIGQDKRGGRVCYRANGYTPQRVSNHAIEAQWNSYGAGISDSIAWGYQEEGHAFYQIFMPNADKTWVYDVASGLWHERAWWDQKHGIYRAHRSRCHASTWDNMHLVGDRLTGMVFRQSVGLNSDNGDPKRWLRSTPHIQAENKWHFHKRLVLDMLTGAGPQGLKPKVVMRFSDDGGATWSNEYQREAGPVGRYRYRIEWNRLGRSRDRCYEVTGSDPIPVCFVNAYLDVDPGA